MPTYTFGPFVLHAAERRLMRHGRNIPIPGKAWQILLMLAAAGGQIVSQEALRAKLWPNIVVEERTLVVHVSTLRRVLAADRSADYIETVSGAGYRLAVPVREVSAAEPLLRLVAEPTAETSLAVRAFSTGDQAEADDYLGVGIADAVSTALGNLPGLTVYPVGAEAAADGGSVPGAGHVLEGSVRLHDERLLVSARLVDAASGITQWSERFEQPRANASALRDSIAQRVADSLAQLSAAARQELHSYQPRSAEAFFLQMRGRAHLKPFTRLPLLQALALFEQALSLDPDYAMAHAGLASTYLLLASTAMLRPLPVDEAMPLARRAAERAIALDDGLAEAWAALGRVKMEYDWDWDGAEADLAHAVALNSNSVEALATFGEFLSAMGRHDEAIEAMEQARRLDPRNVETLQHLGIVYWMAGDIERTFEAIEASLAVIESSRARYGRMMVLDHLGRHEEAMVDRIATLKGLGLQNVVDHLTETHRNQGWRAAMEAWLAVLEGTNRWEGAAMQWMAVGEPDRAMDALDRCIKLRTTYLCFTDQNPYFQTLRGNLRFHGILRTLKFEGRVRGNQRVA